MPGYTEIFKNKILFNPPNNKVDTVIISLSQIGKLRLGNIKLCNITLLKVTKLGFDHYQVFKSHVLIHCASVS